MRYPDLISREIQELEKIILSSKDLILQFPKDELLKLSLEQTEYRKKELIEELELSFKTYGQHSLKFIFNDVRDKIKLETLIENLNSFKGLLDKTYDKVTRGQSNHLPVYFNTVFSGSYGIQLSTPFEEKLIEHDYEKTINETISIISDLITSDENEINETLERDFGNNRKLLNKYSLFFKKVHLTNKTISLLWKSPISLMDKKVTITPAKAQVLYNIFSRQEEREENAEFLGVLKGVSLIRFRIEFIKLEDIEEKHVISAKFNESLSEEVKSLIDKQVIAQFRISIKFNELKDEEEKRYELVSISINQ